MIKMKDLLNEVTGKEHVYLVDGTLWFAHSPGSGLTKQVSDLMNKNSSGGYAFRSDKDRVASEIVKWSEKVKPVKRKKGKNY